MNFVLALLFALGFGFVGSIPLTGPIAVLVLSKSIRGDYGNAIRIGLGASIAEGVYAGIAFFAYHSLVRSPRLRGICDAVSAVVLVVLGIYFARWKFKEKSARKETSHRAVWTGFTISALNPTLLVTWTAAVAALATHIESTPNRLLSVPFGGGAAVGVAGWEILFVLAIRKWGDKFSNRVLKLLVRGVGVVLVGLGGWAGYKAFHVLHH